MAQLIADRRDVDFVLYEQFDAADLCRHPRYADFNRKTFDMIVDESRQFAIKEILPTLAEGDRAGLAFENGNVRVPECFHRPHKLYVEGEWTALTADSELGGQGLPHIVAQAVSDYHLGANYAFALFGFGCVGGRRDGRDLRDGSAEGPFPEEDVHRPMGRHHGAD